MKLVTGATGHAGGAVVRALVERGEPVRAVVRGGRTRAVGNSIDVEVVTADLGDAATLLPHLGGVDGAFLPVAAASRTRRSLPGRDVPGDKIVALCFTHDVHAKLCCI